MENETQQTLELQIKVSKMLSNGFIFSIVGLVGIGSLISLILGLRAMKIIRQSEGKIVGAKLAWWCIIIGGLGMISLPFFAFYVWTIYRQ